MSRFIGRRSCVAALLWSAGAAMATEAPPGPHPAQQFDAGAAPAAQDALLDTLRGGFDLGGGLAVSFGFERSVSINGDLVSQTRFNLPDLSHMTAEQVRLVSDALARTQVIQNGAGNSAPGLTPVGASLPAATQSTATIVQNSLSKQLIQSKTVIDAGVNSLAMLRAMNIQAAVRDALAGALRSR